MIIDSKNFIRNIKIHLLSGEIMDEPYSSIYNQLELIFDGVYKIDSNLDINGDKVVSYGIDLLDIYIEYYPPTNYLWVSCDKIVDKFKESCVCVNYLEIIQSYIDAKYGVSGELMMSDIR